MRRAGRFPEAGARKDVARASRHTAATPFDSTQK